MRYHLYFIDNSHNLGVDLIFFSIIQFDCAHFNYIEGPRHQRFQDQYVFTPLMDCAGAKMKLFDRNPSF